MNAALWRNDFPILTNADHKNKFIYMDSASTTLKPQLVVEAVNLFYTKYTANIARASHFLSEELFILFEDTRESISSFINAKKDEIVFTHNCTDSINLVANGLSLEKTDEVIISVLEHHSNYLPWHKYATVKTVGHDSNGLIDLNILQDQITNNTKLISIAYISNVTGNIQPVKEIAKIAKEKNILFLIDAAQAVGHIPVDVYDIDCDFMAFSAHKMLGPSGVGILYGKSEALEKLKAFRYGGGMVNKITANATSYMPSPLKFEAGTPNIEGILGLGAAVNYLNFIGMDNITIHLNKLESYCRSQMEKTELINFPFELANDHVPIFSFRPKSSKSSLEYISNVLSDVHGIAIREGFQCAQPFYMAKNINGTIRVSLYLYNSFEEIDLLINALHEMKYLLV